MSHMRRILHPGERLRYVKSGGSYGVTMGFVRVAAPKGLWWLWDFEDRGVQVGVGSTCFPDLNNGGH